MNIAIQAADLDASRIDGTRVYISELLRRFGSIGSEHQWHLYHRQAFNPELAPPNFSNYTVHEAGALFYWTQTRFAYEMFKLRPDRLWMPVQALPFVLPQGVKTTVTIHDLAFKYFPDHFARKDLRRLNLFADFAIHKADRLIAVSEATKRDILTFYPKINEEKIRVIHHGFSIRTRESGNGERGSEDVFSRLSIPGSMDKKYILYVGALQPRKNLGLLLDAFAQVKECHPEIGLVLAGEKAWMWEKTLEKIERHPCRKDIFLIGKVSFEDLAELYKKARMFVFPSLYEGFGIPVLEAQASGVPVICANNSSLPEVGGDAALYFDAQDVSALAGNIEKLWTDGALCQEFIRKGYKNIQKFSWDTCAQETLKWIVG